jgi:hypothetical protein
MLNEAHTKDRPGNRVLRVFISRMRHDGCLITPQSQWGTPLQPGRRISELLW